MQEHHALEVARVRGEGDKHEDDGGYNANNNTHDNDDYDNN